MQTKKKKRQPEHKGSYSYGIDTSVLPHRDDCVVPTEDDNPLYPLPPRYNSLGDKERGWWRVNACCLQETPQMLTEAYAFFFKTYVWPRESLFLTDRRQPAPFHYQMIHDVGAYHFNAFGAPRHACKTTLLKIFFTLLLLTRRNYRLGYLTSKQKKYREFLNDIRKQLTNNPLILDDFGRTKPIRGGESWNSDEMELGQPFGSELTGMSLDSRERGWHGEGLGIDDPEKDPDTDDVIPEYVKKLDARLRFIFMPMVEIMPDDLHRREINKVGRFIAYFGTVLGEGMVLNRILTAEPGGPYDAWNRWKFEQESMGQYIWPERWGKRSSELQRKVLGDDAFDAEKQNRPGKSQKGVFDIHPLYHTYHLDDTDNYLDNPWTSESVIRWAVPGTKTHTWKSLMAKEFLGSMNIGIFVDTAHTEKVTKTSDFTVAHVIGNDINSCLWSLDIRRGRLTTDETVKAILDLCFLWKPSFIAMEACGVYGRLADEIFLSLQEQLLEAIGWVPFPRKIGPFNKVSESKGLRIDRISWRFRTNKIRFPYWRRQTDPYDQCWHEVENFTIDLSKLKYDDIVDTIGFTPYCFRGPGGRPVHVNEWDGRTVEQLIMSGHMVTAQGGHLIDMIPSVGNLSDKAIAIVEDFYNGKRKGGKEVKPIQQVKVRPLRYV